MANKATLGPSLRSVPLSPHSAEDREGQASNGYTGETAPDDLDERFREAVQGGDTNGDVVFLDAQGNEIKGALCSKSIFDF